MGKNKAEWTGAGKGLQFREHATRKHGVKFDKYYRGRYRMDGKLTTISFGWESEWVAAEKNRMKKQGMKSARRSFVEYCQGELARLKENARRGSGPTTIKEERVLAEAKGKAEEQARLEEEQNAITFGEYFETSYFPIAKTSKKAPSYRQELAHFNNWLKPVLGDFRLNDIRPIHLEKIKQNMLNAPPVIKKNPKNGKKIPAKKIKKGRSPRMIQYVFSTFRLVWNHARRDGLVVNEWPGRAVKIPKVDNRRMRFLSDEEGDKLLEDLKGRSLQLHDICMLSFDTGLRADEIFSLQWNRVDLDKRSIKVFDSKGSDRVVFMTDRVAKMLQCLPKDGELIFLSREGKQIKEISNSFDRAVKELGLNDGIEDSRDKLVFHSLRHSFASRLVERGVDLYTVSKLLGHSSISMTERYSHLRPATLQAAVKTLEQPTADVIPLAANGKK